MTYMTEQHAFLLLLNQRSNLATVSTLIVTICRCASTNMAMQLLLKAGLRQIMKAVMPVCSPKAAATDCSEALLLIRAKRD